MNPLFATAWDGCHAFIRWEIGAGPCLIRVRYREPGGDWRKWLDVGGGPVWGGRFKLPTHRPSNFMQVELALAADDAASRVWVPARIAKIVKVRATFTLDAAKACRLDAALPLAALVRTEMASFLPAKTLQFIAGEHQFDLESAQSSPFNELDRPGEFVCEPVQGVRITNLTPSTPALEPCPFGVPPLGGPEPAEAGTPNHTGEIVALPPDGPHGVVFGQPLPGFRG